MNLLQNEYGAILEIVRGETRWLRHYVGQVINIDDKFNKGRIQVSIPILGLIDQTNAPWCNPRYINGQVTPRIDDWVEVYFVNGDQNYPVYLGIAAEMKDMILDSYSKDIQIIHEDMESKNSIIYDKLNKVYKFGDGTESYLKGDTFKAELDKIIDMLTTLKTVFSSWVVVPGDGGAALKALITSFTSKPDASSSNILSEFIKGE